MPDLDTTEIVIRSALGLPSVAGWLWAAVTGILIFFFIGWLSGRIWNNAWKLSFGIGTLVMVFSVLGAFSVFNLRSISNTESLLIEQRLTGGSSIGKANRFQRSVLVETWSRLEPLQGQQGLTPPDQSGDEIRLKQLEDAITLSTVSAEQTRTALRLKPPFVFGAPLETLKPEDVATQAIDALNINSAGFPRTISSDNEWTITAATIQANYAFDTCKAKLLPKLNELKNVCFILLGLSILIPIIVCSIKALDDIKVYPKA